MPIAQASLSMPTPTRSCAGCAATATPPTSSAAACATCSSAASPRTSTSPPSRRRNEIKDLFRNCRDHRPPLPPGAHLLRPEDHRDLDLPRQPARGRERLDDDEELLIRRDNVFGTAEEDARRRDFTINGLFYDLEAERGHRLRRRPGRPRGAAGPHHRRSRTSASARIRCASCAPSSSPRASTSTSSRRPTRRCSTHRGEIPKCAPPRVLEEIYRLLRGGAARRSMELLLETGVRGHPGARAGVDVRRAATAHGPPPPGLPTGEALAECRRAPGSMLDEIDAQVAPPSDGSPAIAVCPAPTNALLLAALVAPFLLDTPAEAADRGGRRPATVRRAVRRSRRAHARWRCACGCRAATPSGRGRSSSRQRRLAPDAAAARASHGAGQARLLRRGARAVRDADRGARRRTAEPRPDLALALAVAHRADRPPAARPRARGGESPPSSAPARAAARASDGGSGAAGGAGGGPARGRRRAVLAVSGSGRPWRSTPPKRHADRVRGAGDGPERLVRARTMPTTSRPGPPSTTPTPRSTTSSTGGAAPT